MEGYLKCLLSLSLLSVVLSQSTLCRDKTTCGACMQAGKGCAWCSTSLQNFDIRCDLVKNLELSGCNSSSIIQPEPQLRADRNESVKDSTRGTDAIQLAPQAITITLRPRTPYTFNVLFKQAENYPVDLYYVMDLSQSMQDDKQSLAGLGDKIAEEMNGITQNFRLGFGSFVDKKTAPYVSTIPSKLVTPCKDCVAPYGFKNQMKLTTETANFKNEVTRANISGNLDSPEGGFDAIMQSIVCKDEIGWRSQSRKMLVFSSDAAFHYAGDGKLGGIIVPNDGLCHLDGNGTYTKSLDQDYPSISQLAMIIAEKKVNVIFAITAKQKSLYEQLTHFIEGSSAGVLEEDSSNVVNLIRQNYEAISSSVELKTEGSDKTVDVSFRSKCLGNVTKDTAICSDLKIGDNVTYEVTVEVRECPADKSKRTQTFKIYPVGLTEALTVTLNLVCDCACEKPPLAEVRSPKCNSSGTYECGVCNCGTSRYGKHCECDRTSMESSDYDAACRKTNTSDVCEDRGQCLCGTCDCNPIKLADPSKRYSGKYCECDDYSCDQSGGKLCGGPDKGVCKCGTCQCNPAYNGSACECMVKDDTCRAKNGKGKVCNDQGTCMCGRCQCKEPYRGATCEDCPTCLGKCDENRDCVTCQLRLIEGKPEDCSVHCLDTKVLQEDEIADDASSMKMCQYKDDADGCMFYFAYEYTSASDQTVLHIQKTKKCPAPVNVLAVVIGVVVGTVVLGILLLLIWKIVTTILDKRELARFEQERLNAKWQAGENPLYKQATSTFQNPAYGK